MTTVTQHVAETDWIMSACIDVVSGTPSVLISTSLCATVNEVCVDGESEYFLRCTLDTTTPCCYGILGPITNLRATLGAAGSANVWFSGRTAP